MIKGKARAFPLITAILAFFRYNFEASIETF